MENWIELSTTRLDVGEIIEPAEVLRYSSEGQLGEHIGFRYTRDAFDNWIEREMTVWDATTGAEVLVRRDKRAIFYY